MYFVGGGILFDGKLQMKEMHKKVLSWNLHFNALFPYCNHINDLIKRMTELSSVIFRDLTSVTSFTLLRYLWIDLKRKIRRCWGVQKMWIFENENFFIALK